MSSLVMVQHHPRGPAQTATLRLRGCAPTALEPNPVWLLRNGPLPVRISVHCQNAMGVMQIDLHHSSLPNTSGIWLLCELLWCVFSVILEVQGTFTPLLEVVPSI